MVVAAVRAILQPVFNVAGCRIPRAALLPVIIVNGPLATQLSINGDTGCFGPGYRAHAAIGRALRLVIPESGGADTWGRWIRPLWRPRGATPSALQRTKPAALGAPPRGAGLCGQCEHRCPDCYPSGLSGDGNNSSHWTRGPPRPSSSPSKRWASPVTIRSVRERSSPWCSVRSTPPRWRCRSHENRRAGVHLSGGAHAHAQTRRHCALRQSQLAVLD